MEDDNLIMWEKLLDAKLKAMEDKLDTNTKFLSVQINETNERLDRMSSIWKWILGVVVIIAAPVITAILISLIL